MVDHPPPYELAEVLANARGEAAVLRRAGNEGQADYIERLCDAVKDAAEDYMRWLEEPDALLKSGWSERTLRRRFTELLECGLARWNDGRRQFRACGIPQRADTDAQRRRGARMVTR